MSHRIHIGLEAADLERSIAFYRVLLDAEPTKLRPGYAKFEPDEPAVSLSLVQGSGQAGALLPTSQHFGIRVETPGDVRVAQERLAAAGLATRLQEGTDCCYAVQDKVWASDPDGHRWEVYTVLDPEGRALAPAAVEAGAGTGCGDGGAACCTVDG